MTKIKNSKIKVCVDIGGTKTFVALVDKKLRVTNVSRFPTYKDHKQFFAILEAKLEELSGYSDTLNVAVAGMIDKQDRMVVYGAGSPLKGLDLSRLRRLYKNVNIEHDGKCFAIKQIMRGKMGAARNGIAIVWGTAIGGAIIIGGRIYRGMGFASELGKVNLGERTEDGISYTTAGKGMVGRYGLTGEELHSRAEAGEKEALDAFREIGRDFGYYICSMCYVLDPELIAIGGSFTNSWKFLKDEFHKTVRERYRREVRIVIDSDKYYVLRGCYFLDEYNSLALQPERLRLSF